MQTLIRFFLLAFLYVGANIPCLAAVSDANLAAKKQQIQRKEQSPTARLLDTELKKFFPANAPGAAVLIVKNGEVLIDKGYGMANLELQVPMHSDHLFHVASVGKQFTAAAILLLSERGKLNLNDKISKYLPKLPSTWNDITVEHLLSHTSGIRNLFEDESFRTNAFNPHTPEKLLERAIATPTVAAPGEKFAYATVNYTLLAIIIQKLSGESYASFIAKEILHPLNMGNTVFDHSAGIIANSVTPYQAGPRSAERFHPSVGFGGGSFYSTTADLAKWTYALHNGKVVSPSSLKAMHTRFVLNNGSTVPYGYGTRPRSLAGAPYLQSNGDIQGFHSELVYLPHSKVYVSILSNGESLQYGLSSVVKHLAIIADHGTYTPVKYIKLGTSSLEKFAGIYKNGKDSYRLHVKDGKLYLDFGHASKWVALSAVSANEFCYDSNSYFRIRFSEANDGKRLAQWFEIDALDGEEDPVFERRVSADSL